MGRLILPTGGPVYVDANLGSAGSRLSRSVSTQLGQMRGKVNSCKTRAAFNALFCIRD